MKRLLNLCALTAVCVVALLQGCAALSSKELSRSRALSLLSEHSMFKKPAVLSLSEAEKFPVPAEAADEPEPKERAIELFFEDRPAMGVLRQLRLVEATAAAVKRPEVMAYTGQLTMWTFRITPRLTAKGKEAASEANGSGEEAIPLLRREIVEVTGLTKEGENRARAEFRWKSVPTPVGEAFDPTSRAFQSLPEKLRQRISQPSILGNSLKLNFNSETRKAVAYFQLYDDGWRVEYIQ